MIPVARIQISKRQSRAPETPLVAGTAQVG